MEILTIGTIFLFICLIRLWGFVEIERLKINQEKPKDVIQSLKVILINKSISLCFLIGGYYLIAANDPRLLLPGILCLVIFIGQSIVLIFKTFTAVFNAIWDKLKKLGLLNIALGILGLYLIENPKIIQWLPGNTATIIGIIAITPMVIDVIIFLLDLAVKILEPNNPQEELE